MAVTGSLRMGREPGLAYRRGGMRKKETSAAVGDGAKSAPLGIRRRWRRRIAVFGLLVVVASLLASLVTGSQEGPAYRLAHAEMGSVEKLVRAVGKIQARDAVDVGAEISGTITAVHVDFGTRVKKGDPLAEIDRAPFAADVARAEAALDAAQAARIAGLDAALRNARRLLDKTVIRAPIDGVVIDRRVAPGQTVVSAFQAQTLFTIAADLAQLRLVADVTEADIGVVTPGQQVRFSVDAWPQYGFTGLVTTIRPAAQIKEGLVVYPVLVDVDNADGRLLPGMTADVQLVVDRVDRALRVPLAALAWRPGAEAETGGLLPKVSIQIVNRQEAERLQRQSRVAHSETEGAVETGGRGIIYVLFAGDRRPTPVSVKLGLVGERYAEIREGDLKPGDAVVVGTRESRDGGNA